MAEVAAAQETYKEELRVCGIEYPLNQAIFCLSNAMLALTREEKTMFKITKDGVEYKRDLPSMRHANDELMRIKQELPDGMPVAYSAGGGMVVGNEAQGMAETVYKIEVA